MSSQPVSASVKRKDRIGDTESGKTQKISLDSKKMDQDLISLEGEIIGST